MSSDGLSGAAICALLANGRVRCLGPWGPRDVALGGPATEIASGLGRFCAVVGATIECWAPQQAAPKRLLGLKPGRALIVSPVNQGVGGACTIDADGRLSCLRFTVSEDRYPLIPVPTGARVRAASPWCAISESGAVHCREGIELAPFATEVGSWRSLSAAHRSRVEGGQQVHPSHAAGLDRDGTVRTAGSNFFGALGNGQRGAPSVARLRELGRASSVVVARTHVCALVGGRVACWGESTDGQVPPARRVCVPACEVDRAASDAAYQRHLARERAELKRCLERPCPPRMLDCTLGCAMAPEEPTTPAWANVYKRDPEGCLEQPNPSSVTVEPAPVFVPGLVDARQVVVEDRVSCALREDGTTRCWGRPAGFALDAAGKPR